MKAKYFIIKVGSEDESKIIESKLKNALNVLSYPLSVKELDFDAEYIGRFLYDTQFYDEYKEIVNMFPEDD